MNADKIKRDVPVERANPAAATRIRVLILEDNPSDADLMVDALRQAGVDPQWERVETEQDFAARLTSDLDLILSDYSLPQFNGVQALQLVRARGLDVPFILVSGSIGEDIAVEAMREGADDYLLKDRMGRLGQAAIRAIEKKKLREDKRRAEIALARVNRVLAVLSGVNSAIVRIRDRQELLDEACRIAKELGNFRMSWIGTLDRTTLSVWPTAWAGLDDEFVRQLRVTARDEGLAGQGTTPRAVRSQQAAWDNDFAANPDMGYIRRYAIERGVRSAISLPLLVEGELEGVFSLYAEETGFFTTDEVKVLEEMASDISFALQSIVRQQKIEKLSRTRAVSSGIGSTLVRVRNRQELFQESCRIAVEDGQFPFAWIGVLDPATQDVTPVAWAGESAEELTRAKSSARDDTQRGMGAVGRAIRECRAVVNNDIAAKHFGGPRIEEILRLGFRSQITLPLFEDKAVIATLTMYAREPSFFDEEELKLLTELAADISFALENISRQQKLDKLSRIRAVSSEINAAIVRIREREALLRETSRIAVEHGKFELVWIALLDQEKQKVQPVAWTGFSPEAAHAVTWASTSTAGATLGEVIRTRKVAVRNDIETKMPAGVLRQEAMKKGYRSTVCVPFMVNDSVVAAVILFAPGVGFFDEEELALLNEVAADVSFALQAIGKQEKLEYLSYYDVLTGLPNRHLFVDRLSQQMRSRSGEPQMVALIVIDLERFRNINESLGHRGGDELLSSIAHRLEHAFHGKDYLARISSNGFGAIVRGMKDAADIVRVVENEVVACFSQPFTVSDRELRVSMKAGIALFPADGEDADTLFRNAESALKRAKASGDRYLFYAADMNAQAVHAMALETRLRKAVDAEQFVLHYQPKIELATGRICGLEALIRWNDPESGLVPPGRFIPLLEETGLILEVGRWALVQALADYRDWISRGCTVPRVAVNVSAIQLQQKNFTDIVTGIVQQAGGLSQALELEITESLIMKDIEASIDKLALLRESGIHIAMDDFGTGYSSLSYLARLPINTVKIDRAFVSDMAAGADAMSIVSAMIALTHSLNLRVVAEGVETEEQARMLRLLRCDEAQGYLFSKPVPADQIEPLLRAQALGMRAGDVSRVIPA